jgi:lipopolysaccharide transport system permease protein
MLRSTAHPRASQKRMIHRITELYSYRELIKNLVIRDLKVRYKNSVLGILWSLLNPLLMTIVFTVVFTLMLPGNIRNYPVFFMCGYLPWSFLADTVIGGTNSIVGNAHLIKKVYFPREVLPISDVLSSLVNFLLALIVLFGMMLVFGINLTASVLLLPVVIAAQILFILGLVFFLSTANVFYRDTQHIMQVVMQAWFFLTPIFYSMDIIPERATVLGIGINLQLWVRRLNPMASLIDSYRDILYWETTPGLDFLLRTIVTCIAIFVIGYLIFCRYSHVFGEEV